MSQIGDFDGDNDTDIIVQEFADGNLYIYINDGFQNFTRQDINTSMTDRGNDIKTLDIDKDGKLDFMIAGKHNDKVLLFRNQGDLSFKEYDVSGPMDPYPESLVIYDFDLDGRDEVVVTANPGFVLYYFDF